MDPIEVEAPRRRRSRLRGRVAERPGLHLPWWLPTAGGTLLLVGFNSPWFRLYHGDVYRLKRWVYGLHREMNFAVWWSAAIYFLGAALFYEASGRAAGRTRRAYLELSALMMAFVVDEVACLHERVSGWGGWPALAPFGLVMIALLADALIILFRQRDTRAVAWLALAGFLVMGSVAGQEYAEHNLTTKSWSEYWGRFFEEASELVGALLVLAAALRARGGRWLGPLGDALPDPLRMPGIGWIVGGGFLFHLAAAQSFYVMQTGPPREMGNLGVIYPLVVFLLLACYAYHEPLRRGGPGATDAEVRGFWAAVGLFFLACSIGSMQNLWGLFGKVVPGLGRRWFYEPEPILLLMVGVAWFVGLALWRQRGRRVLWLLGVVAVPWIHLELVHPAANYLASGLFALLSALALLSSPRLGARASPGGAPAASSS